jgi:AcrR family transcriptional regulator
MATTGRTETEPPARSSRRRGRPSRLEAVLEEATRQFNVFGVSGAQLGKVAGRVGVARGTLYHYFADREDLVFRCYLRSCAITATQIASADRLGPDGLGKVLAYIGEALGNSAPALAVISDTDYLTEAHRRQIEQAHRGNLSAIERFLVAGQADGSLRHCDPKVASQIIFGIQTWLSLAPTWVTGTTRDAEAATTVASLISDGIAAHPENPLELRLSYPIDSTRPKSSFDREHVKELKRDEVVAIASRLFNRRSVDGTSVEDIAGELGATPGAVYYYFPSKNALILACYERAYDIYNRQSDLAAAAGRSGLERLLYSVRFAVQATELAPLVVFTGAEHLPAKGRRRVVNRLKELIDRGEAFYRQGIADGSLRTLPVLPTVLALGGSVQRASQWHTWGDLHLKDTTADEIVTLFAQGLRRR